MKKLFLLDAMALIYRAHFALNKNPRFTSKGLNTSAILGFANTLLDVLKKEKPTHMAVVFDTQAPTERHTDYVGYKAHRQAMPEDLATALPYIVKLVQGFNIPVLSADGYEADDIIGTLAKKAEQLGFMVYCMTPDKDFAQLVSENIFIYKPARMGNGVEIMGVPEVLTKWEIARVEQVTDILGLWGDASDNIPGIPGIGEKTAKLLIKAYGSLEGVIAHSDKLKGKLRENLEAFSEQGLISKKLATILLNAPVDFNEEELKVQEVNRELLEPLFIELEFKTMGKRVFGDEFSVSYTKTILPLGQGSLFDAETLSVALAEEKVSAQITRNFKTIENTPHSYHLVNTFEKRQTLIELLSKQELICFDTETTGRDVNNAELVGLSFAIKPGEGYYVPTPADQLECSGILQEFKPIFENEGIKKVGQNLKFDILMLKWCGIQVKGDLFDTMLAHYLLDPDGRHNMDLLAENYLSYTPVSISSLIGTKGKEQKNMREVELEKIKEYAVEDADITLQLKNVFEPLLKEKEVYNLAHTIENPLVYVLADMERAGVRVDQPTLELLSVELRDDIAKLEETIYHKAGVKFNIASPKQLGEVLFGKLQLDPKAKKTKTGQYQTGEDILTYLANKSDIAQDILDYRQLQKLKSTYVDALPQLINSKTGRIHTSYNQAVTSTGRLSSNNPNLQNIPIRTERGRQIRKAFIPRNEDHILISADYSQIELRLIAEISRDENMLDAFSQGLDIHTATAAKVYAVPLEEITPWQRRNAKAVNFGIIYGQSAFGLAQTLAISRTEAAEIIHQYFIQYPGIKNT